MHPGGGGRAGRTGGGRPHKMGGVDSSAVPCEGGGESATLQGGVRRARPQGGARCAGAAGEGQGRHLRATLFPLLDVIRRREESFGVAAPNPPLGELVVVPRVREGLSRVLQPRCRFPKGTTSLGDVFGNLRRNSSLHQVTSNSGYILAGVAAH